MTERPKLAVYWAASCGGCEIAVVNLHEKILELDQALDFFFCPCLLDTKKADLEALPDGAIAVTFFNGAIRTAENAEMAHLLRKKSRLLVAFGACAWQGGIPALSNLSSRETLLETVFLGGLTLDNPAGVTPQPRTRIADGELELPPLLEKVRALDQVVEVDYYLPGCPPESRQIWKVVEGLIQGRPLPARGSVIGAGCSTVCEECARQRNEKRITRFHRTYEIIPHATDCLAEQGIICMGLATRSGCGALCPGAGMPCTGCYGPPEGVLDQGAKMVAALGSMLELGNLKGLGEQELRARTEALLESIPDCLGTFYKYSAAGSLWAGSRL